MKSMNEKVFNLAKDTVVFEAVRRGINRYMDLPKTKYDQTAIYFGWNAVWELFAEQYLKKTFEIFEDETNETLNKFIFLFLTVGYTNSVIDGPGLTDILVQLGINTAITKIIIDQILNI